MSTGWIRQSWQLARSNLSGRVGRTVLLVGAVALASSLIVAVSSAVRTSQASLEYRIGKFIGASDARIIHPGNGRFPVAVLDAARGWPEVEAATGRLLGALSLVHADRRLDPETGRVIRTMPYLIGVDFTVEPRFRPFELDAGALPETRDEILIDPLTADALGVGVGAEIVVERPGAGGAAGRPLRVAGIYTRKKLGVLQRPRIYVDRERLAEATGRVGELTSIYLIVRDDVDVEAFCARYADDLPPEVTLEPAELVRTGFDQRVKAARIGLLIASVLTFISAGFIILVGLTTGVTERERELAVLRAIGATRGQLVGAQLGLGMFYGVVGAAVGVPLGFAVAGALAWRFADYLPAGFTADGRGVVLAFVGSVGAGLLGALFPAIVAGRATPLDGMGRPSRAARPAAVVARAVVGLAGIGVQLALTRFGDEQLRFWTYAMAGLPVMLVGWFLLAVPALVLVTRVVTRPLAAILRLPADLLRGSVMATPLRHGFTAGTLMVGMATLVSAWSSGVSIRQDWLDRIRFADGFALKASGISPAHQAAIAALPFVDETCAIGYLPAQLVDRQVFGLDGLTPNTVVLIGFETATFFDINTVTWRQGDPETAIARLEQGDSALVAERFLTAKNVGLGDELKLRVGRTTKTFEIVGVVSAAGLDLATELFGIRNQYTDFAVSCVFVDARVSRDTFKNDDAYIVQVNLSEAIDDEVAEERIMEVAPGVRFRSGRWISRTIDEIATALLAVQSTIAFAALVLASIAVGHVVAANVRGRRFEYGVLRAIGGGRSVLVRLILAETALIAVAGALIGTGLGLHVAWMDIQNLRDLAGLPLRATLPLGPIAIGFVVLLVLTLAAAAIPALGVVRATPARWLALGRNE